MWNRSVRYNMIWLISWCRKRIEHRLIVEHSGFAITAEILNNVQQVNNNVRRKHII
jgi:hypothetical protein